MEYLTELTELKTIVPDRSIFDLYQVPEMVFDNIQKDRVLFENDSVRKLDADSFRAMVSVNNRQMPSIASMDVCYCQDGANVIIAYSEQAFHEYVNNGEVQKVLQFSMEAIYALLRKMIKEEDLNLNQLLVNLNE